ncbi:HAD domain-containing protein [Streptomyces sp. NPDC051940]|uniref:HAD domain-containing protein n=1 Tax=Streptomyces sp. NPDC051940 TaxID=3155675 RepID=UPI0034211AE8
MTARPLLLLDVDGPLNPYAAQPERRPAGYTTHRFTAPLGHGGARPLRVWLSPAHGPRLLGLPYELVWATTWMHGANTHIAPVLGLPELPVIEWPELFAVEPDGVHWKAPHILRWAAGRAFAWVDDEITDADERFFAAHHPGPALLHHVDPRRGLRDEDFAALAAWADENGAGPEACPAPGP